MATFYVLPARYLLGQRFSDMLAALFPGTQCSPWDWPDLAETLATMIESRGTAFVVYREDLDERLTVKEALVRHFGAAFDDEIIEMRIGVEPPHTALQRLTTEAA
jgi:hypothetical protein